ncbi:MAG: hypothetical protein U1E06_01215 [Tabrizicola sp.]|uniref:hypothetical protein n=1 Tax=Tabrizicola sp. TaxID=2005166 RepID=UPI002735C1F5|nr:hypothetical protein [Tabrizicola sp.]MDP3263250.1 hypothetical protein [Tabrizicola sp.]MDP3646607.1 hypothetical protein [Paracoccaceae bacterium]MDZ4065467.1 hypothetical protein [Tabrizicola sp.]
MEVPQRAKVKGDHDQRLVSVSAQWLAPARFSKRFGKRKSLRKNDKTVWKLRVVAVTQKRFGHSARVMPALSAKTT